MHRNAALLLVWLVTSVSACGRLTSSSTPIATQEIRLTPAEDSILVFQRAWVQTALRGEAEASTALMADSFRLVAPRGLVVTKQDWVEKFASIRTAQHDSVTYDHVYVHLYGDYAVLSGEYTQRTTAAGQRITGHGVTVSMWVHDGTRWRVLASVYPGPAQRP